MAIKEISVVKAKVHNLKNISVKIPKDTLTTITGPSGSGKSSLAFDTIYVEGQRRYIESLSSYARQFLGQHQPPDVESITGLSPAIAIDQKTSSKNPRSTVGTVTEIYDYFRILFARIGTLYCPESGEVIKKYTPHQIASEILKYPEKTKVQIIAPIVAAHEKITKGEISRLLSMGFSKVRLNGEVVPFEDVSLRKIKTLDIVIDRIVIKDGVKKRVTESVEQAIKIGKGKIFVLKNETELIYSEKNISLATQIEYPDLEPRLFSFNSPLGACSTCNGLGESKIFDIDKVILDNSLSISEGAIPFLSKRNSFFYKMLLSLAEEENIDLDAPLKSYKKKIFNILIFGTDKIYKYKFRSENSNFEFSKEFPGVLAWMKKKYTESASERLRVSLEKYMDIKTCPDCEGQRLNQVALSTKINNKNIMEFCSYSIENLTIEVKKIKLTSALKVIADKLIKEILSRINFLNDVGLNYLTLNRSANSLSGGESQRIRLATQIGSALTGVLYVLDEPSIGLHQRDNDKLIETLKSLRDLGNTVLVVEHDEDTMKASDYIIDIGPGAGVHGGNIVATGTPEQICKNKKSITADYLNKKKSISSNRDPITPSKFIKLIKAKQNNIKNITVNIPIEGLTCVTGVSGSGKSTLIHEVLVPAIKSYIGKSNNKATYARKNYHSLAGVDQLRSIIELDQSPIGRTPKSNPATYSGVFDEIRALFSKTNESQVRGYRPGRFSFNVKGGRCEACEGNGVNKIEMHFLPDVFITCPDCNGSRYNDETLSVEYKGKNISDILNMSIEESVIFFTNHTRIKKILSTLNSVGLGYMKLGQPATTLSGGEAQRLKLAKELAKNTKGTCLYVLDEPTTGLHFQDVQVLLDAINQLISQGHPVLIIEHNLDIIKSSDYIIDLGPDGGDYGGEIVAEGTIKEVIKNKKSYTAKYLKKALK